MSKGLPYKNTRAMPGTDLYKYLLAGEKDKAEKAYQEAEKVYGKLMGKEGVELMNKVRASFQ